MSFRDPSSLLSSWQNRFRAFFARRCPEQDDVDDLVKDAIVSILRCCHTFAHRSTVCTWVYAVCRNVLSNYFYYRARDDRRVRRLSLDPPAADPLLPVALRDALGRLPECGKRLYVLYYVDGLSIREIAARLGRPDGTVKCLRHGDPALRWSRQAAKRS